MLETLNKTTMKKATVKQLIKELQEMPQDAIVTVGVSQYNKVYPLDYLPLERMGGDSFVKESPWNDQPEARLEVRLSVLLPYGVHTVTRK